MPKTLSREAEVLSAIRELVQRGASSASADDAMASAVAETSLLSLSNLDEWERKLRAELRLAEQRGPSPGWQFWRRSEPPSISPWLDICNGDGFKREIALRSLVGPAPNSFFLTLAIRRLNDWVREVRAAARKRIPHIAESSAPAQLADALWHTFVHWNSWGRVSDAERDVVTRLTADGPVALELKSRILEASAGPASHVLAQVARTSALDSWLTELASDAVQPSVRAKAYRFLFEGRVVWTVGKRWVWTQVQWCKGRYELLLDERHLPQSTQSSVLLRRAAVDRSPLVRRIAADFLPHHLDLNPTDALTLASRLASDSNSSVAERGRYALSNIEQRLQATT